MTTIWALGVFFQPGEQACIVKDVGTLQQPYYFSLNEFLDANAALFFCLAHLHLLDVFSCLHAVNLSLHSILFISHLPRLFKHEGVEGLHGHAVDGGFACRVARIVVAL